jgi:hypothetical protein
MFICSNNNDVTIGDLTVSPLGKNSIGGKMKTERFLTFLEKILRNTVSCTWSGGLFKFV